VNVPRFIRRWFRAPYDGLRHYGVVHAGVLYRSGQPRPADLETVILRDKLKTVIALRGSRNPDDPDSWEQEEREVCRRHGVNFVTLPCNHKNPPTPEQIQTYINVLRDSQNHPVLVHCRIGQQRTGMFCALYRVHFQGVDPEAALREMDDLGFGVRKGRHRQLLEAFRRYSKAK
jgi:protein tyrosine/serine phosphatase